MNAKPAIEARPVQADKPVGAEPFQLANAKPANKPVTFASSTATQRKLLDGLDCLPGQRDLF